MTDEYDLDELDPLAGGILTDDEFGRLSPPEQLDYLNAVEALSGAWTYAPVQWRAEVASQTCDELLYGGAAGGGKSEWLLHHAYDLSLRIPGHVSLLLRKTFPELERSLIYRAVLRFDPKVATWRKAERRWYFKNGSIIEFGHLDTDTDITKYLSAEYAFIGFDESTQFTQWQITMVSSRCRVTRAQAAMGARMHIALATNPGGASHGYHLDRFVEATNHGLNPIVHDKETGRTVGFIPAKVSDNPYMDPAYERWLASLPEIERAQYLYGDWDVFAGQYFAEFNRRLHVIKPFAIPAEWPRGRGVDYGYRDPFACVWVAWDPDGRAFFYREFEQTKLTPESQARVVNALSRTEDVRVSVADPSAWAIGHGAKVSVQERWARAGMHCTRAANARVHGWSNVRSYLQLDADGKPGAYFFDNCPRTIKTMVGLVFDKTHVEDAAKGDDHLPDGVRYILLARPRRIRGSHRPPPATMQEKLDASWERRKKRRRARQRMTPRGVM